MDYIQLLQQRIQSVNDNVILGLIYDEYFKLEDKITQLQRLQISKHEGFDDKILHSNLYDGFYAKSTQAFADAENPYASKTSKSRGSAYNFVWGGEFFDGFKIKKEKEGIGLFSSGAYSTRSNGKTEFFESYDNMFGLNTENTATIENEVLYYVLEKTFSKLYQ